MPAVALVIPIRIKWNRLKFSAGILLKLMLFLYTYFGRQLTFRSGFPKGLIESHIKIFEQGH